ncbi:MAG: patatin-like phospholipase family protein [Proteobacteria bacterium]|nr:patatin-like phospholipase family protein [Pseudomonadota bacterium]
MAILAHIAVRIVLTASITVIMATCASTVPPKPTLPKQFTPGGATEFAVSSIPGPRPGHCVRVLSIDGGGIRGIIPALLLAEIENQTKQPIAELFDLMVGTSTGGIIALGLSKPEFQDQYKPQYTAQQLADFYETKGEIIFSSRFSILKNTGPFFRPKYATEGIETVLKDFFGDTPLDSALTNVQITAYEIEPEQKHYFFDSSRYPNDVFFMRDVARAASAAPTYFPPVRLPVPKNINDEGYITLIDGGVFANNPALYALLSAPHARAEPPSNDILLVSLGTGVVPIKIPFEDAYNWGLLGWAKPLVNIVFSDPGVENDLYRIMPEPEYKYYRFQPELKGFKGDLDDVSHDNIQKLKQAAQNLIAERADDIKALCYKLKMEREPKCPPKRTADRRIWKPSEGEY